MLVSRSGWRLTAAVNRVLSGRVESLWERLAVIQATRAFILVLNDVMFHSMRKLLNLVHMGAPVIVRNASFCSTSSLFIRLGRIVGSAGAT